MTAVGGRARLAPSPVMPPAAAISMYIHQMIADALEVPEGIVLTLRRDRLTPPRCILLRGVTSVEDITVYPRPPQDEIDLGDDGAERDRLELGDMDIADPRDVLPRRWGGVE